MLRVLNPVGGSVSADLSTTKADKTAHGFGVPGMREIAERYHGILEAGVRDGRFELLVACRSQISRKNKTSGSSTLRFLEHNVTISDSVLDLRLNAFLFLQL